ncbi:hypothetical protein, partial [Clostridium perfringens]
GTGGEAVSAGAAWPLAALAVQAEDVGNAELRFVLALARDDGEAVRSQLATALAQEEGARIADAPADTDGIREPVYIKLLADAMDR